MVATGIGLIAALLVFADQLATQGLIAAVVNGIIAFFIVAIAANVVLLPIVAVVGALLSREQE